MENFTPLHGMMIDKDGAENIKVAPNFFYFSRNMVRCDTFEI